MLNAERTYTVLLPTPKFPTACSTGAQPADSTNCCTGVPCVQVTVDGVKHIMIFARRPLEKGEEITYDYKLPIEEIKIICHCGARNCRGYMN
jgi:SET domain-containing protein